MRSAFDFHSALVIVVCNMHSTAIKQIEGDLWVCRLRLSLRILKGGGLVDHFNLSYVQQQMHYKHCVNKIKNVQVEG